MQWINQVWKIGVLLAGIGIVRSLIHRRNHIELHDKVILITGGSRGLGLALAEECLQQGAQLVLCARNEVELQEAKKHLQSFSKSNILTYVCDISKIDQVQQCIGEAVAQVGHIDILINNAGIISAGPWSSLTRQDYEEAMASMFWGMYNTTMEVLPSMVARHTGRIVNITSIGGKVSIPLLSTYSSAKFAAVGFSEGLHTELAKEGVLVTTVVPGLMRTGSHINTTMKGEQYRTEYTLFTLLDTLPFTSMSARKAAQRVVKALRNGQAEVILSWQAQLFARLHGLFPGLTINLLTLLNYLLPGNARTGIEAHQGVDSETAITRSFVTRLGRQASERYNEYHQTGK